jgi:hypothetical protein
MPTPGSASVLIILPLQSQKPQKCGSMKDALSSDAVMRRAPSIEGGGPASSHAF